MTEDDGSRAWSKELRAEPRRRSGRQTSRWLTEEDGGRAVHGEGQNQGFTAEQPANTRQANPVNDTNPSRPTINLQSLPCPPTVPSFTSTRQDLAHISTSQPFDRSAFTASTEYGVSQYTQGIPITNHSTFSHQPLLTITAPDNALNNHSLPNNSIISQSLLHHTKPTTSYTLSPTINDALKIIPPHQFSFTATTEPNLVQPINPSSKSAKSNPTHKITRTGPKHEPTKSTNDPTRTMAAAMEVQTEKKRRRENEKEKDDDSTVIQHFLTAGPGSQDCRDQ
jgi:hypothetical protein